MKPSISRHIQTDTKALILKEANALLLTHSYAGLSFQQLADRVGIRKASLYHHFDSKETLGIALLATAQERFLRWSAQLQVQPVSQQLLAYVQMFRDAIGAGKRLCPVGATACEWDALEPALQAAVQRFHQTQMQWLESVVMQWEPGVGTHAEAAVAEVGTLAQQRAMQINAVLQGALVSARIYGDVQVFDMALAPLLHSLKPQHTA